MQDKGFSIVKYLDRVASLFFLMSWIFASQTIVSIVLASIAGVLFIVWFIVVLKLVKERPSRTYGIIATVIFVVCIAYTVFMIVKGM